MIKAVKKSIRRWGRQQEELEKNWYPMGQFVADDVFIAGYPKSGNTWMQLLLSAIQFGLPAENAPDTLVQELVPDVHYKRIFKRFRSPTCFKTHALPRPEYRRCIHLVRDARDVMCSYRSFLSTLRNQTVSIDDMLDGRCKVPFGLWHEHVRQWNENPYKADVMLIKYEDLKTRCVESILQIATFIDCALTRSEAETIAEATHVTRMMARESKLGWNNDQWPKEARFIRRGISGGFRDELTEHEIHRIESLFAESLQRYGYL